MFRRLSLLAALLTLAPAAATAQTAQILAENMQSLVGRQFSNLRITAVSYEGNVVVIGMDGPRGWRASTSPEEVDREFVGGFCLVTDENPDPNRFFASGVAIRVDTTEAGQGRQIGRAVNRCPEAGKGGA